MRSFGSKADRRASATVALTVMIAVALLSGCITTKKPGPETPLGMDTSEIYRLALEALKPIAERHVQKGDRVLLLQARLYNRVEAWRFVPTPGEIPQDVFESEIRPGVSAAYKATSGMGSESPEVKALRASFSLDQAKKAYLFRPEAEGYDERLVGRALASAGYSGVEPFSLTAFSARYPYFVDALEGGMQAAILGAQAKGFERLRTISHSEPAAQALLDGRLVFGTNVLDIESWQGIQEANKPNPVQKLLMYSVDNALVDDSGEVAFQLSLRLIDAAKGGQVLWSGSKTLRTGGFPASKIPSVGSVTLTVPAELEGKKRDALARSLRGAGVKSGEKAVLLKVDDIPVFGAYVPTREDYAVERALEGYLGTGTGLSIVDKLYKRSYKERWQLVNAVHCVNPLLSGDYAEFPAYYGARYLVAYRVLWRDIQGIMPLGGESDPELAPKILGIYVKVVDMAKGGTVLLSDFLPFVGESELQANFLYRCYVQAAAQGQAVKALRESGALGDGTPVALVNRRMELTRAYLDEPGPAKDFMLARLQAAPGDAVMRAYFEAYEVIRTYGDKDYAKKDSYSSSSQATPPPPPTMEAADEVNVSVAVNLMQTWFEDGICSALVADGLPVTEKLESLYARYLLRRTGGWSDSPVQLLSLSPLMLSLWGASIKEYYGIDKILYFSFMDTRTPEGRHIAVPAGSRLARYFPVVSDKPDSLRISVVSVASGDYDFNRDFILK